MCRFVVLVLALTPSVWPQDTIDWERARRHWAFQPIKVVDPPNVRNISPIDTFIRVKLKEAKLVPAGRADRATLLRRVTFDLTGLPPTPDEIEAFIKDTSPGAFERVV